MAEAFIESFKRGKRCGTNSNIADRAGDSPCYRRVHSLQHTNPYSHECTRKRSGTSHRNNFFRLLKDENGDVNIVSMLLVICILCFFLIEPIDESVFMLKHQQVAQLKNQYLAKMRVEGWLSADNEVKLKQDLANIGCVIDSDPDTWIQANAMESKGDNRIMRSSDISASTLTLKISCRPEPAPFRPSALIRGTAPSNVKIVVGGTALSEYVGS